MIPTRRHVLTGAAAAIGGITILPYLARAQGGGGEVFETNAGNVTVHPVNHASFVLETPAGTIYGDPVGDAGQYADLPRPDLILVTHEHGDHYKPETLAALVGDNTQIVTNPAVFAMLTDDLKAKAAEVANGASTSFNGLTIDAIPAYNTTEGRLEFHPKGRDNGYVLGFDGFRVYVSGDTEDIPEMRALTDIGLCFLCMNLPFTMSAEQAASAVKEFKPRFVYPYHYRGRDDGTQDPQKFAEMVGDAAAVKIHDWYAEG
jgi:L-ascorbate metabolism protein UlaG (beta-lactamase superfamily)